MYNTTDKYKFLEVFNNKFLFKYIFKKVHEIYRVNLKVRSYKWEDLLLSPEVMAGNNYLSLLKHYFSSFNISNALYGGKSNQDPNKKQYSHYIKIRMMKNTIRMNNLEIMRYFTNELIEKDSLLFYMSQKDALFYAAKYNRMEIIQLLLSFKPLYFNCSKAMTAAPHSGNMEILQFLASRAENKYDWYEAWDLENHITDQKRLYLTAFERAALVGNLDMIKWLAKNRSQDKEYSDMVYPAIVGGHIHVLKYLAKNRLPVKDDDYPRYTIDIAATYNRFELLKWINENVLKTHFITTTNAMDKAAKNGNLEMIKWLHHNRTEGCTSKAMDKAAENGHLDVIIWLNNHYPTKGCSTTAMDFAAANGHLDVIEWLHYNRTEGCTTNAIDFAIENENYDIVEWLVKNRTEGGSGKYKHLYQL